MSQAKHGDTVRVHYTAKLDDGQVFDSSRNRDPLQLTIGAGQFIDGFEQAIEGMSPGQSKSVGVPAAKAYGPRQNEKVFQFDRTELPGGLDPELGQELQIQMKDGSSMRATIAKLTESTVTLDANHPLAGKDLVFDLELLEIV